MPAAMQQQKQNGPRATPPNLKPQASPEFAISNRYSKLLEFLVTYTKQTVGSNSNRYKTTFRERHFLMVQRPRIIQGKVGLFVSVVTGEAERIDQAIELSSTELTLKEVIGAWF